MELLKRTIFCGDTLFYIFFSVLSVASSNM